MFLIKKCLYFLIAFTAFIMPLHSYDLSPVVASQIWDEVAPYLLPEKHPLKKRLDAIFSNPAILSSRKSMQKAGFQHTKPRRSGIAVARHPYMRGYRFKIYRHDDPSPEWHLFAKRALGAKIIRESIATHGYKDIMAVPRKWIYPLPPFHDDEKALGPYPKHFILVVEDMEVMPPLENEWRYKHMLTERHLDALYTILTENKLIDSIYIDNVPFTLDNKLAFIDTEHYMTDAKPVHLERLMPFFGRKMRDYWREKIK